MTTLARWWLWLRRGRQTPYVAVQAFTYSEDMQTPDERYDAVQGSKARATERRVKDLYAQDRKRPKSKRLRMVK